MVSVESEGDLILAGLGVSLLVAVAVAEAVVATAAEESREAERFTLVDDVDVAVDWAAGVWTVDARDLEGLDLSAGNCSGETGLVLFLLL